jgi:hypothetical protein
VALSPSAAHLAAGVVSHTGSQWDSLRLSLVRSWVCQRTGLVRRTGSQRSATASTACGPACEGKTPLGLGVTLRCSTLSPKRAAARPQLANGDYIHTSTRPDGIQDSPRQGKGRTLAGCRHPTSRWRGAADRRGRVDGATTAFARAWVYGVIQMLGAYACETGNETGKAKTFQRSGLLPLARSRMVARPWQSSGRRSRWRKDDKALATSGDVRMYVAASSVRAHRGP